MATNISHPSASTNNWFAAFTRQGYYFRYAAMLTLITGLYVHITRLFLGNELLLQHVVTPQFDRMLTIPMSYAAITGLLAWRHIRFQGLWHKLACGWIIFYMGLSGPIHIAMAYFGQIDPNAFLAYFPMWYSIVMLPMYTGMLLLLRRLRFQEHGA